MSELNTTLRVSLVIPTIGRTTELARLFESIRAQQGFDLRKLECIVVDQNPAAFLNATIAIATKNSPELQIKHLNIEAKGVSNAKNIGIQSATGDVILFPDDDCWFSENLLEKLAVLFRARPEIDGVFFKAKDPTLNKELVSFPSHSSVLSGPSSHVFCAPQIAQAYRIEAVRAVGGFNENFRFGEETDFALRVLQLRKTVWIEPSIEIYHPMVDSQTMSPEKAYNYGKGFGVVCVKNGLYFHWIFKVLKQFAASLFYFCTGRFFLARQSISIARGRLMGGLNQYINH